MVGHEFSHLSSPFPVRGVRPSGTFAVAEGVHQDGDQDDETDDELLQVGRDVQQVQPVADDADDQGTHQGSPDRPLATQQAGTADDGRRDGICLRRRSWASVRRTAL